MVPIFSRFILKSKKDETEERKEVVDFVEHIPASEGDQLLVSTAATRFIVVRHPFARIFAIWNSLFRENHPDGDEIFKNYQIARYVRTKPPPGYKISFAELCQFVSEDAQAKADPLFKPLTGKKGLFYFLEALIGSYSTGKSSEFYLIKYLSTL